MGSRRIEMLKAPWDYYWPKVRAVTCIRETGPVLVKDEVADAAIRAGVAIECDPSPAMPKRATRRNAWVKPEADAATTDTPEPDRVDREDLDPADSADGDPPVADAG